MTAQEAYEILNYAWGRHGGKYQEAIGVACEALKIKQKIEEKYHNFSGYDLEKCLKYGNENAEQQRDSYAALMMYEIASEFDDILDE